MVLRIVICDDDPHIRLAVEMKLQRAGYDVEAFCNGADAWAAIERQAPDLLITDWQMPKMSGPELCREILKHPEIAGFPILALTAKALEVDEAEVAELGIRQVLNKPFSPRELLGHVQNVLGVTAA
jgi:DNA-binding response OmpR family regulator